MRQEILLQILIRKNPVIQELVDRLGLEIVRNPQRDAQVAAKVQELASTSVLKPRRIYSLNPFQSQTEITDYLTTIYPIPWKYPLPSAPF